MSLRLFLSAVTDPYKTLRTRIAENLRPGGFDVRHQTEFVEIGHNTLVKLAMFIQHESDVVLHLVGAKVGSVPPADETKVLLSHCGETALRQRFPRLFEAEAFRRLTYTQWEAWLGHFYGKPVIVYQANDAVEADTLSSPMLVAEHLALIQPCCGYPVPFDDEDDLIQNKLLPPLTRILNQGTHRHERPWHMPYGALGELFIGRDGFLADLRQRFDEARAAGRWPKQVICGVGGIGKTRVVAEYALKHRDDYTAVLLVSGDSPESLRRELASVAGLFDATIDLAAPEEARERATLDWLLKNPGWLLIIDNADTQAARDEIAARLGQWANGHLLITARFAQWPRSVEKIDLHVLSAPDATQYLLRATSGSRVVQDDDAETARQLADDDLGCLCLALQQAAAYIETRRISIAEYRRRWKTNEKSARTWADAVLFEYHRESKVAVSVATTWLTTFAELTSAARTLLEMLSFLAPEPIPSGLFDEPKLQTALQTAVLQQSAAPSERISTTNPTGEPGGVSPRTASAEVRGLTPPGSPEPVGSIDVELVLAELRQYSLVMHDEDDSADSVGRVHRVLQLITRERLTTEQRQTTLNAMLTAINAYTPTESYDVRTWPILEPLRPHLTATIEFADNAGITEPTTRLLSVMGELLHAKALFTEAEPLMRRALAIDEQSYGAKHPDVARDLNNLALLLQATNRLAEAEPLMARVVMIVEKSLDENHPNLATALNNLAQLLKATNRLAEAEPLMRRVLAIDEQSYGAEHPRVAIHLNNLAQLLQATNRLAEAEPLMARVVMIFVRSLGENHPNVATALNNLALLLQATNRLAEAESLKRRALAIDEQSYGAEHPDVATDLNNLAQLLLATNRLAEAEPLMRRALAIDEQSYGAEHPDVAIDLNNLAQLLKATNRLAEAEPMMRRALAIDEQSYGAEHPDVARDLNNLAMLLQATNRLAEAEPMMRRALHIFQTSLGDEHPNTRTIAENYEILLAEMEGDSK